MSPRWMPLLERGDFCWALGGSSSELGCEGPCTWTCGHKSARESSHRLGSFLPRCILCGHVVMLWPVTLGRRERGGKAVGRSALSFPRCSCPSLGIPSALSFCGSRCFPRTRHLTLTLMLTSGVARWVSAHIFLQSPGSQNPVNSQAGASFLTSEMPHLFGGRSWFTAL